MQKNKQKILGIPIMLLIAVFLNTGVLHVYAQTNYLPQQNTSQTTLTLIITEAPPSSAIEQSPIVTSGGGGGGGGNIWITAPQIPITARPATTSVQPRPALSNNTSKHQIVASYRTKIRQAKLYAAKIKKYKHLTKNQKEKIGVLYKDLYRLENRIEIPESLYPKIDKLLAKLQLYVEKNETMTKNDKSKIQQIKKYTRIIKKRADLKQPNKNKLSKLEKKLDVLILMKEISIYDNENLDNLNRTFKLYAEDKEKIKIDIYGFTQSMEETTKSLEILVDAIDENSLEFKPNTEKQLNLPDGVLLNIVSLEKIVEGAHEEFKTVIKTTKEKRGTAEQINNYTNNLTAFLLLGSIFLLIVIIKQQNEN